MADSSLVLKMAQEKMKWLSHRQKMVAQNVMNARTPKYIPKDLISFKKTMQSRPMSVKLKRTRGDHIQGKVISQALDQNYKVIEDFRKEDLSPSGNGVVMEKELMKSGEIGLAHKQASVIIAEYLKLKKIAIHPKK